MTDQPTQRGGFSMRGRNFLDRLTEQSRAYVVEYIILLTITLALIFIANSLFGSVLTHLTSDSDMVATGTFAYTVSVALIAALIVLVPLLYVLTKRTVGSEYVDPTLKNLGWRKATLAIFLLIVAFNALGYTIAFVYELVSWFAHMGTGAQSGSRMWWTLVSEIFALALFGGATWLYSNDYRYTRADAKRSIVRWHRYALVYAIAILTILFIALPMPRAHKAYLDGLVTSDLSTIQSETRSYYNNNAHLPEGLENLKLSEATMARAKDFKYTFTAQGATTFEVCGLFRTDAHENEAQYGTSSPLSHSKGVDCFSSEVVISSQPSVENSATSTEILQSVLDSYKLTPQTD